MAKAKPAPPDTPGVDALLSALNHPLKAEMQALRRIILNASPALAERVKWNAPSFFHPATNLDLAAYHTRETGCVHVVLVFHGGKMIDDRMGLLEGDYKDRRMAKFYSMDDIAAKQPALEAVVRQWVQLVEGAA